MAIAVLDYHGSPNKAGSRERIGKLFHLQLGPRIINAAVWHRYSTPTATSFIPFNLSPEPTRALADSGKSQPSRYSQTECMPAERELGI